MHTKSVRRRLTFDLNPDGSIAGGGAHWEVWEYLVRDDGTEAKIGERHEPAKPEEWPEWLAEGVAATHADCADALLSAKDNLIDHFLSAADSEKRYSEGRQSLHAGRIAEYQRAVEQAPSARGG